MPASIRMKYIIEDGSCVEFVSHVDYLCGWLVYARCMEPFLLMGSYMVDYGGRIDTCSVAESETRVRGLIWKERSGNDGNLQPVHH